MVAPETTVDGATSFLNTFMSMAVIKESYVDSVNKKVVQKLAYSRIKNKFHHLIGLGGPDLPDYLKLARDAGMNDAIIYEFDVNQLLLQASKKNNTLPTTVIFGNVLNAPAKQPNTFYDLDFCCSVKTAVDHIKKFKEDSCMFTFSIRPLTLDATISMYIKTITGQSKYKTVVMNTNGAYKHYEFHTKTECITAFLYRDTVPMIVFLNKM